MSLLVKISNLVLFVIVANVWGAIKSELSKRDQKGLMSWSAYLITTTIVDVLGFFILIWLMSRFFSIELAGLFLVAASVWIIMTGFMWALMGTPRGAWRTRYIWAAKEFTSTHIVLSTILSLVNILASLAFAALAYNLIFRYTIPSEYTTLLAFQYTLIFVFLRDVVVSSPIEIGTLLSENLDEDTRTRTLIGNTGLLGIKAFFFALLLWSLGSASTGYQITSGSIQLTISPVVLVVLVASFMFFYFLPSLAGSQRAKRWREHLLKKRQAWLEELLNILDFPTPSLYISKLEQLQVKIDEDKAQFIENDWMVKQGIEFDQVNNLEEIDLEKHDLAQVYFKSRQLDSRFQYVDFLKGLSEEIQESISQFKGRSTETKLITKARAYADAYRARKDEFAKAIILERNAKPSLLVGLTFVLSPIAAQILSELAKWVWTTMLQAAGS